MCWTSTMLSSVGGPPSLRSPRTSISAPLFSTSHFPIAPGLLTQSTGTLTPLKVQSHCLTQAGPRPPEPGSFSAGTTGDTHSQADTTTPRLARSGERGPVILPFQSPHLDTTPSDGWAGLCWKGRRCPWNPPAGSRKESPARVPCLCWDTPAASAPRSYPFPINCLLLGTKPSPIFPPYGPMRGCWLPGPLLEGQQAPCGHQMPLHRRHNLSAGPCSSQAGSRALGRSHCHGWRDTLSWQGPQPTFPHLLASPAPLRHPVSSNGSVLRAGPMGA